MHRADGNIFIWEIFGIDVWGSMTKWAKISTWAALVKSVILDSFIPHTSSQLTVSSLQIHQTNSTHTDGKHFYHDVSS